MIQAYVEISGSIAFRSVIIHKPSLSLLFVQPDRSVFPDFQCCPTFLCAILKSGKDPGDMNIMPVHTFIDLCKRSVYSLRYIVLLVVLYYYMYTYSW